MAFEKIDGGEGRYQGTMSGVAGYFCRSNASRYASAIRRAFPNNASASAEAPVIVAEPTGNASG